MREFRFGIGAWLGVGVLVGLGLFSPSDAIGRHEKRPKASVQDQQQAQTLVSSGNTALAANNLSAAKTAFEEAFRKNPAPEVLFRIGKLAEAEGRIVAAQDVMRRFLQETGGENDGPDQKDAQRIVQLEAAPSGEVSVIGARGAWVTVDDHLIGALPLQMPLLLEAGNHRIVVEFSDQRIEEQVKSLPGQTVEMRFNQKTGTVVVSVPPALVLIVDGDLTAEQQKALHAAVGKQVLRDRQVVVPGDKAIKLKPALASCLSSASCLAELGLANEALYVLRVKAKKNQAATPDGKANWDFAIDAFDPSVGDYAGRSTASCSDCASEQAFAAAATSVGTVIQQSSARARGSVEITSKPPGADVLIGGEKVGVTPYKGSRFVGDVEVELRLLGQPPFQKTLSVQPGQTAQVEATLAKPDDAAEPAPFVPPPPKAPVYRTEVGPRPKWRLLLGGSLIGAGLVVAGFGVSALSVDGKSTCPGGTCQTIYATQGIGSLLLGIGAASVAGGIVAIVLPGPKRQVQVSSLLAPGLLGLSLRAAY